jgi:hypothetical protein
MRGIAISGRGEKPGSKDSPREFLHFISHGQEWNGLQAFEPKLSHRFFSESNFVEHDLRGEKLVPVALQVPPISGELLASGLQKVAGRARDNVARYRAFDVDAHDRSLHPALPEGSNIVVRRTNPPLRRADSVEALRIVRGLRVGELKLAGAPARRVGGFMD